MNTNTAIARTEPAFPEDHPFAVLSDDDAANIDSRINLALDGIMGWSPVICFTQDLVEALVTDKQITDEQAHDIIEYTRSF